MPKSPKAKPRRAANADNPISIATLPFVRSELTKQEREKLGAGRDFWHVHPTGRYEVDYTTGEGYAHVLMRYERYERMAGRGFGTLVWIVGAMRRRRKWSGIENGFLATIGKAAARSFAPAGGPGRPRQCSRA